MFRSLSSASRPRLTAALLVLGLPLALGGCMTTSLSDLTASIREPAPTVVPTSEAGLRSYNEAWGKRYASNPDDRNVALAYAQGLRQSTQYAQAVAVLQRAAIKAPNDLQVLGAYGKALADAGRLTEAAEVLSKAHTPERPNWSILSAQGSVADQLGDHTSAQELYQAALKIKPGEPAVLSNLGLSYALSKQLPQAETTLRQAADNPAADSRVRQNLSLVLALEGKFKEAEEIGQRDLPPAAAAENVTAIRKMIAQSNTWRDLQKLDGTADASGARTTRQNRVAATAAKPALTAESLQSRTALETPRE